MQFLVGFTEVNMRKKVYSLVWLVILGFLLVSCGGSGGETSARPTRTPKPDRTERPSHFSLNKNREKRGEYHYRGFTQTLRGMVYGPNGKIYIADWTGHHIITIDKDGNLSDLGLWKDPIRWKRSGPYYIAFDSTGALYAVSHGRVHKLLPDGTMEEITGHNTFIFGGIAINSDDQLFFTERGVGEVFTLSPDGERITIASGVEDAEGIVFGLDGTLYVAQSRLNKIVKIDVDTGTVEDFFSWDRYLDTPFLAVDADGDIWVRGQTVIFQISPEGVEKPFFIGGEEFGSDKPIDRLRTSGGIAFDEEGQLWIASYSSKIMKLSNPVPGEEDSWGAVETVHPGLESRLMSVDADNNIFIDNINSNEIWKIDTEGNVEILLNVNEIGGVATFTSGLDGFLYLSLWSGELMRMDENKALSHYADLPPARSMTIGSDGLLYAIPVETQDGTNTIYRISGIDAVEELNYELDGYVFGSGPHPFYDDSNTFTLAPAADQGLHLFDATIRQLFYLGFDGNGQKLLEVEQRTDTVAVSKDGTVYYIGHGDYTVYTLNHDGKSGMVAFDVLGDPFAFSISMDGKTLFISENGAVDIVPIR
jgi:streptogramin lyase